ncbi:MAG: VCBS repeat-containing protein, partial [Gammaproteobacteria bacterium]|nr:VCBS repeat-containing protein [Gammaproteobacteria bacterium]
SQFKGPDPDAGSNLTTAQARFPVTSTEEMKGFSSETAESRYGIRRAVADKVRSYPQWEQKFRNVFNDYVSSAETLVSYDNIALALAEYQRSQIALNNPFFRFIGGDDTALTTEQKRGAVTFFKPVGQGGGGCNRCHSGEHFSDEEFYAFATPQIGRGKNVAQKDFGRYNVTRTRADLHRFRTPSLLNVELTHPYMHAGSLPDLNTAIRWHISPQQALDNYDFSLAGVPQLNGLGVTYANAEGNTQEAIDSYFDQFVYSSTRNKVNFVNLSEQTITDLASFLNSLTDPCLKDVSCVSQWLPDFSEPSPDGMRLIPELRLVFDNDEALPEPKPEDVSNPRGNTPDLGDVPVYQSVGCTQASVVDPVLQGTQSFFKRTELATGLSYYRRFTSSAWGEFLTSFNSLVNTGSVAVADIDGDCDVDAVLDIGNEHGPVVLINSDGYFSAATDNYGLSGINDAPALAMADLNGDGWPDLFIGNMLTDTPSVWFNNGQGRFVRQEDSGFHVLRKTLSSAFYDVDGDGDLDVFLAHWDIPEAVEETHLWLNDGTGYFTAASANWGFSGKIGDRDFTFTPAFADFNGDHIVDLASTSDFLRTRVYQGKGDNSFMDVTNDGILNDENGMGAALGDFDNDGDLDWFVSSIYDAEVMSGEEPTTEGNWGSTGNRLYRNDSVPGGTIVFSDVTTAAGVRDGAWAWGTCMKDFNNDGWLDIYQVNGYGMEESEIYPDEQYIFTLLAPMGITGYASISKEIYPSFADFSVRVKEYVESLPDFFLNINQKITGRSSFEDILPDLERLYTAAGLLNHGGKSWEEFVNNKARFFINNQDGTFTEKAMEFLVASRAQGRGISCSDFDRDGDIDIFIVNNVG